MIEKVIRGRVLTFNAAPDSHDDTDAYSYWEDGAILVRDTQITACGAYDDVSVLASEGAEIINHQPCLLSAGFIDTHLHFPQAQIIASWGEQLLDWLEIYTYPAECEFADTDHAKEIATRFFYELIAHGTTTAASFCTSHRASVDAYFREAVRRNMCVIGGKTMMDRNVPEALRDSPQRGYDECKELISRWHGRDRCFFAVTPRFAITSTPEQLLTAQALVREHPDCYLQSHLAENQDEITLTTELYPDAPDYLGVYETYGLLGTKSLLGHSIHLNPREQALMAESDSVPVFCPTSNLFLGSGLFDKAAMDQRGVRSAIATDIGAGTSFSMLRTLDEGYKILQLQKQNLSPFTAFYWITRGNAEALSLVDRIGTLDPGTDADIVVLDPRATTVMDLRMERVDNLAEELFVLQTLGDDRAVVETYIAGAPSKSGR